MRVRDADHPFLAALALRFAFATAARSDLHERGSPLPGFAIVWRWAVVARDLVAPLGSGGPTYRVRNSFMVVT